MKQELLIQANDVFSKCGRPIAPEKGMSVVYIPKSFLVQYVVPANSPQTIVKKISGDTTWSLRAISGICPNSSLLGAIIQILLPNGHFLINNTQDMVDSLGNGVFGSTRYAFTEELDCAPETDIRLTLYSVPGGAVVSILFEGAYKYYLKTPQKGIPLNLVSAQPRYQGHSNQAILGMAPWQFGEGPRTPPGYSDSIYLYGSQTVTISSISGSFVATGIIPIEQTSDFQCRRLLFYVTQDAGVTGATFLARLRTNSGYALMDEPLDVSQYLNGAPFAHDWEIKAGDTVYIDYELVDFSGSGNAYIQCFLDGCQRVRS